jgi:hypothetical protein
VQVIETDGSLPCEEGPADAGVRVLGLAGLDLRDPDPGEAPVVSGAEH